MKPKHVEILKLNKTIIIGAIVGIAISAISAQLFAEEEDYLLTTYTVIVEYAGFFSSLFLLFYLDNRKNKATFRADLIKFFSSIGISEVVYIVVRWVISYYLLTINYEPSVATLVSQGVAWAIFMVVVNLIVKKLKLYKS
jgi:cobalamin synthase